MALHLLGSVSQHSSISRCQGFALILLQSQTQSDGCNSLRVFVLGRQRRRRRPLHAGDNAASGWWEAAPPLAALPTGTTITLVDAWGDKWYVQNHLCCVFCWLQQRAAMGAAWTCVIRHEKPFFLGVRHKRTMEDFQWQQQNCRKTWRCWEICNF